MFPDNDNNSCDQPTPVYDTSGQATSAHNQPQQALGQPEGPASIVLESPIPGYRLKPEIAQGGMGIVYSAECLTFGREVAIKVMKAGMSAVAFNREAQITARLPHPGIPPVHALGTLPDGRPYLVMKLIKGETLDSILKNRSDFSSDRGKLVAVFEHICQAVGFAHAQGIIHRDLKPSNVMVGAFGEVQVMDWGLAREVRGAEEIEPETVVTDQSLTMAGQIKGTPAYMAPEQARGEELDARADVFALGGMLAAILTGHPPFSGSGAMEKISRAAKCELGETQSRLDASGADPELIALCRRCLESLREDRPADGTNLAVAVAEYRADVEEKLIQAERDKAATAAKVIEEENTRIEADAKAEEWVKRRRTQWALGATVILLLAASVFGLVSASNRQKAEDNRGEAERQHELAKNENEKLAVLEYGASMRNAYQEWRDGNHARLSEFLEGANAKHRGWEWGFLNRLRDPSIIKLNGHEGKLRSATIRDDGKRIVTCSEDGTAKIWDAWNGKQLVELKGHSAPVNAALWSPDQMRILTCSDDKTVRIWDGNTGNKVFVLNGNEFGINTASWKEEGKLVLANSNNAVHAWDAQTWQEVRLPNWYNARILNLPWSADGHKFIVTDLLEFTDGVGPPDNIVHVYNLISGNELLSLKGHLDCVAWADWSPDGKRIATSSGGDKTCRIWDARTGEQYKVFENNKLIDRRMKYFNIMLSTKWWSDDCTRFIDCDLESNSVRMWDAKNGVELLKLIGHDGLIRFADWSADGKRILTSGLDNTARVWDAGTGKQLLVLKGGEIGRAMWCSDDNRIFTFSGFHGTARLWDAKSENENLVMEDSENYLVGTTSSFNKDGSLILSGDWKWDTHGVPTITIWNARTGRKRKVLTSNTGRILAASWSPDGKVIVTGGSDGSIHLLDSKTGVEKNVFRRNLGKGQGPIGAISISPNGKRIATGIIHHFGSPIPSDYSVSIFDSQSGNEIMVLNGHVNSVFTVAWSPDATRIVTGGYDGTRIWDALTGKELLHILSGATKEASWNPNCMRIATVSEGDARVWDARLGVQLLQLKSHSGVPITSANFNKDGTRIVTGDASGTVRVWDAKTAAELLALKGDGTFLKTACFSPDGTRILTSGISSAMRVWDGRSNHVTVAEKQAAEAEENDENAKQITQGETGQ